MSKLMERDLQKDLQENFNLPEDHFGCHESDLHVLPIDSSQMEEIRTYLRNQKIGFQTCYADVEGSDWYRSCFLDIPFMYKPFWDKKQKTCDAVRKARSEGERI